MKRYSFFLALAAMLVLSFGKANATIHTIGLAGTNFTPDSTLVNPGDTVRWTWVSGTHTTTSGTGAMDPNAGILWDQPISSASPTLDFVFTAPGSFPYFCRPHEFFGMNGTIFVQVCCVGNRGDVNGDGTDANILDLTYLVDRIFRGGPSAVCDEEADLNSDGTPSNILDLTFLVDRIFRGGVPAGPC